ncbi:uncharacterized protein LOC110973160 [Acanthaster planci]|uniref:Uncharacterized protein LOC110973160 n=1 Tax=Acanthaster planci TaxID=133434 RepID=A0A8B7XFA0_ACAPL|nr:uncharacterized protein LOC110973160 [Acanthaster planci]
MEEAGTLVTDNPNLNRGLSAGLSSTKEKSVSKVLMGLKHLKADDIGVLKYTRSSELGTQVKCSNHAHDVSSRKQVNMWHRDQRIAVAKLARGQQKMFRNLIRVQNEKRRIQRRAHIRKQREMQIELREKAVREREEAQDRLRNMIMTEVHNEKTLDDDDKVFPPPLPEISEERDKETTGGIKMDAGSTALKNGSSHFTRSSHSGDYLHSKETIHSSTTSQSTSRRSPSQNSLSSLRAIPNRETSEVLEMVTKANVPLIPSLKEKSVIKENGTGLISRPHFSREAIQTNVRTALEFEKGDINRNKVLPGIVTNISKDQSCQSYDEGTSYEGRDSVFEDDVTAVTDRAKDQATKETMKRKQSERSRSRNKYHIGIPNRTFRLPDYQAPVVTSVVQYHRNSAGSLVASEVAVKPASEEYKLPSRRAEYMVEKALEWERKREDKRQKKLKGFLDRMKEIGKRLTHVDLCLGAFADHKSCDELKSYVHYGQLQGVILNKTKSGTFLDVLNLLLGNQ